MGTPLTDAGMPDIEITLSYDPDPRDPSWYAAARPDPDFDHDSIPDFDAVGPDSLAAVMQLARELYTEVLRKPAEPMQGRASADDPAKYPDVVLGLGREQARWLFAHLSDDERWETQAATIREALARAIPDPTHGRIDLDIQASVDELNPSTLGQRVAMENTLQERRARRRPTEEPPGTG